MVRETIITIPTLKSGRCPVRWGVAVGRGAASGVGPDGVPVGGAHTALRCLGAPPGGLRKRLTRHQYDTITNTIIVCVCVCVYP